MDTQPQTPPHRSFLLLALLLPHTHTKSPGTEGSVRQEKAKRSQSSGREGARVEVTERMPFLL